MTARVRYLFAALVTLLCNWGLVTILAPARFHFSGAENVSPPLNIVQMPLAPTPVAAASALSAPATPVHAAEAIPAIPDLVSARLSPAALRFPAVATGEIALTLDFPVAESPALAAGRLGDSSQWPQLLEPPDLSAYYPQGARAGNLTGFSLLRVSVTAEGTVQTVEVLESSPAEVFDAAARRVGKTLRFRPARVAGKPVAVRTRVKLNWRLD